MRNLKKTCMTLAIVPLVMLFTATDAFGQSSRNQTDKQDGAYTKSKTMARKATTKMEAKPYQAPTVDEQLSEAKVKLESLRKENASAEKVAEVKKFIALVESGDYKPNQVQAVRNMRKENHVDAKKDNAVVYATPVSKRKTFVKPVANNRFAKKGSTATQVQQGTPLTKAQHKTILEQEVVKYQQQLGQMDANEDAYLETKATLEKIERRLEDLNK